MIKKIWLIVVAMMVIAAVFGIIKDAFIDSPVACRRKIDIYLTSRRNDSIEDNLFSKRTISYKLYYGGLFCLGTFKFNTVPSSGETVFILEVSPRGGFLENSITAWARMESHFQYRDFPSLYAEKTQYRTKVKSKLIEFDRNERIAKRGDRKIKITEKIYDPVGAFVHILSSPFEKDAPITAECLAEDTVYDVIAVPAQEKDNVYRLSVEIKRKGGGPGHSSRLNVWVTADNARIPLAFKSWSPVGYVSAILEKIE